MGRVRIAIGEQLKRCSQVITLGVRPQIADYTAQERKLLREADIIFHPTSRFVDHLAVLDKKTFPSLNCYRLVGNRLKQVSLLRLLNISYPRTRVYFGDKQKKSILNDFAFPLIAKKAISSVPRRSIFFVDNEKKLKWYTSRYNPAFLQEYVQAEHIFLVAILNYNNVVGYWQKTHSGTFERRAIKSVQGEKDLEVVELATKIAKGALLSDLAVEIICDGKQLWVSDIYFQYEEMGELQIGKERVQLIMELIERGEL